MALKLHSFTFLFYDYETFGIHPALDKPAQFACIRTDANLNIIDIPNEIFCIPPIDYFPDPEAILITGISPNYAKKHGLNEFEFAQKIYKQFKKPNTCIVGYNNIHFDDEVTRNIFYRNFIDPYEWSWKNGNSRWDILNILRAYYSLRPEGICWSISGDNNYPSFKLSNISKCNNINHLQAHSAVSDVYATLQVAQLLRKKQPKLFNYCFKYRSKKELLKIIDIVNIKPMIYISQLFGLLRKNISIIAPISWHPGNSNILISFDLTKSAKNFLNCFLDEDVNTVDYSQFFKQGIVLIYINRCPILTPVNAIKVKYIQSIGIDLRLCNENLLLIRNSIVFKKKLKTFIKNSKKLQHKDVDLQLYNDFFNNSDKKLITVINTLLEQHFFDRILPISNSRIQSLMMRCISRNYPDLLNNSEKDVWKQHCRQIVNKKNVFIYVQKILKLLELHSNNVKNVLLLKDLLKYSHDLHNSVLNM
ncbi:MAG: exodeoxyribonuclease I [Buchnera aphidicola (Schlechtendalia peitan)]